MSASTHPRAPANALGIDHLTLDVRDLPAVLRNLRAAGAEVLEERLLPAGYREVGLRYFLRRMTVVAIAWECGMSRYEVRRIISFLKGWGGENSRR